VSTDIREREREGGLVHADAILNKRSKQNLDGAQLPC
jgi:hypothetical protein